MGMLMQNLVLAVQNTVDVSQVGAASASVAFFRSLGGAIGVSVLGAVLASRVKDLMISGLLALGQIFAIGAVVAVVSLLAVLLIREIPAPPDRRQALTGLKR